jgi:hypothetical protein
MDCPHCGGVIDAGAPQPLQHPAFDDVRRGLLVDGQFRPMPPAEWKLLSLLRERFRRPVRNEFLAASTAVRRPEDGGSIRTLVVTIHRLRPKLDGSPFAIPSMRGAHGLFPVDEVEFRTSAATGYSYCRLKGHFWRRARWQAT